MEIDSKTIKALSAETRVRILKILNGSRRIAADISKEVGLAPSTVNEHLKTMESAGLVKKNDTGHKWIYYEITEKGKSMITPKTPVSIILALSLGIGMFLFGSVGFLATNTLYSSVSTQSITEAVPGIAEKAASPASAGYAAAVTAMGWLPFAFLAAGIILIAYGFIKLRRK